MKNRSLLVAVVVVSMAVVSGCEDSSPTQPARLTPTSAFAGSWNGTFDPAYETECDSLTPARASFDVQGSTLTGTVDSTPNGCGFANAVVTATIQGDRFIGTVTGGLPYADFKDGRVVGTLSGGSLEVILTSNCPGFALCIPGGQMHLRR